MRAGSQGAGAPLPERPLLRRDSCHSSEPDLARASLQSGGHPAPRTAASQPPPCREAPRRRGRVTPCCSQDLKKKENKMFLFETLKNLARASLRAGVGMRRAQPLPGSAQMLNAERFPWITGPCPAPVPTHLHRLDYNSYSNSNCQAAGHLRCKAPKAGVGRKQSGRLQAHRGTRGGI